MRGRTDRERRAKGSAAARRDRQTQSPLDAAAQQSSTATLVPDPSASVDFESAEHVFIEGDNLEVLKLLQKAYASQVKLIFIDPPYNTGGEFIYTDNYRDGLREYLRLTGQVDEAGR